MEERVIYEVLRVIKGKPIFLEAHMNRMENSFNLINKKFELSHAEINKKIEELIKAENKLEGNIKITYNLKENELKVFFIEHSYPTDQMYKDGVKTILYFGERENPNAKIINEGFREEVTKEINEKKAYEAILVDKNGYITEGSKSNIFMVKDNELLTSPTKAVLPGVTRAEIIKIAKKRGIVTKEVQIKFSEIDKLDGMFISGTSPQVLPISMVNDIQLNSNQNEIIKNLIYDYNSDIDEYIKNH